MFRLLRHGFKTILMLFLVASVFFNLAIFMVSGVYTAASSALGALGVTTVAARENGKRLAKRTAKKEIVKTTTARVNHRLAKGATRNIGTSVGEAIPFMGVAVIAGALALEVKDACDTSREMAGLEAAMLSDGDAGAAQTKAMQEFDCAELIPKYQELPGAEEIWASMRAAPGAAWDQAKTYVGGLYDIEWSATFEGMFVSASGRIESWTRSWFTARLTDTRAQALTTLAPCRTIPGP